MKRIILFMLLLLIAGCGPISSPSAQPTYMLTPAAPPTMVTMSPTLISELTPIIQVSTLSSEPTLSAAEAETTLLDLHQNNGGCLLPCWWGLMPGETSMQTVKSLFESLTAISIRDGFLDEVGGAHWRIDKNDLLLDTLASLTYNRLLTDRVESLKITMEVKKELEGGGFETVWENPLNEQYLHNYMLPQILSVYGQPKDVLIYANEGWRYFELILDYSNQGFVVWYSAPLESSADTYLGCISKAFTNLYLWAPEFSYTWSEGVTGTGDQSEIDSINRDFKPLQEVTSLTLKEFSTIFMNSANPDCLQTQKTIWPGP
jgi:hypothetical protein